jgi:integrase
MEKAKDAAKRWQIELEEKGGLVTSINLSWPKFAEKYERQYLSGLAKGSLQKWRTARKHFERVIGPRYLRDVCKPIVSRFVAELRAERMKETTIYSHLRQLKAALNWAENEGHLKAAPNIKMPTKSKGKKMRGRPITGEEFDRLLSAVDYVHPHEADKWRLLLRGLWLSGLRLSEALELSWDPDAVITVMMIGRHPKLRFYAEGHKAGRDELTPITPDFAELLYSRPERSGLVFGLPVTLNAASRVIQRLGKRAGVKVCMEKRRRKIEGEWQWVDAPKFASAHDLRRSFGTRWAGRVKPATLQRLMRHANIETTLAYYVDQDVDEMGDELAAFAGGTTLGTTRPESAFIDAFEDLENCAKSLEQRPLEK